MRVMASGCLRAPKAAAIFQKLVNFPFKLRNQGARGFRLGPSAAYVKVKFPKMRSRRDGLGDFGQMQSHRGCVEAWQECGGRHLRADLYATSRASAYLAVIESSSTG